MARRRTNAAAARDPHLRPATRQKPRGHATRWLQDALDPRQPHRTARPTQCRGGNGKKYVLTSAQKEAKRKAHKARMYAKALKGLNQRDEPITDRGLKRMKLQRLASGGIIPL